MLNIVTSAPAVGGFAGLLVVFVAWAFVARSTRRYEARRRELLHRRLAQRRAAAEAGLQHAPRGGHHDG